MNLWFESINMLLQIIHSHSEFIITEKKTKQSKSQEIHFRHLQYRFSRNRCAIFCNKILHIRFWQTERQLGVIWILLSFAHNTNGWGNSPDVKINHQNSVSNFRHRCLYQETRIVLTKSSYIDFDCKATSCHVLIKATMPKIWNRVLVINFFILTLRFPLEDFIAVFLMYMTYFCTTNEFGEVYGLYVLLL